MPAGKRPAIRTIATLGAASLVAAGLSVSSITGASAANITGTMVLTNVTHPGGGVWLPGPAGTPGHFWMPDGVLGFCRVDPAAAANPPFATSHCTGTAKAGMQAVYDAANKKVYVADGSSKSVQVVRFDYDQPNENLINGLAISVPNPTAVGGGSGGGRPASVALSPDGTKLYLGYIKSGDIMVVTNPATLRAGVAPAIARAGVTSDGRGTAGFAMVSTTDAAGTRHDGLYVAEIGGFGLSSISDIDGTGGRPACGTGPSACAATGVTNAGGGTVSFFPGGLAYDGTILYVGDAPRNLPASVIRFNPATGAQDTYSTGVSPSYTSAFDGQSRAQYSGITGIGIGAGGDVYVGDDPTVALATPPLNQGHLWRVKSAALTPAVTSLSVATGPTAGGTAITVTGTNLVDAIAGPSTVSFGTKSGTGVACTADGTSCTATSPAVTSGGTIDVRVTNGDGQTSPVVAADQFTYADAAAPPPTGPVVTSVSPSAGLTAGGTSVTITGSNLVAADGASTVSFGTVDSTTVACGADGTSCTATSPAGTSGTTVDITVTTGVGTSSKLAADRFTYRTPLGSLYSHGITAPKGGLAWVPGALGGHFWISDHSNGLCRLDAVAGSSTLHAVNTSACDPGFTIGSPGQVAYEPRANADGTHWLFVPDNAVKSPGVWRLTFDPSTETISNPVGMAPGLMDNLKTNSLVLSADGHDLYVGDLVDGNIRRINGADGDPRLQTVDVVAVTQAAKAGTAARGINGTMAILGTKVFLPENNAATYFDTTSPCAAVGTLTPCPTITINFLATPAPVFIAGVAADPVHNMVYLSNSSGGATAAIYRIDATALTPANPGGNAGVVYVTDGVVPAAGSPEATVWCSTTCTRPADPALTPGGRTGFSFAQGLYVDPTSNDLFVTEDASAGARAGRGHAWTVPYVA